MGRDNRRVGKIGETIAAGHLRRNGYRIIAKNIKTPFGELDIVAKKKGILVFVEVKTRTTDSLGPPYLSVTKHKQWHIITSSISYLKRHGCAECHWRIDIVSVKLDTRCKVENIEVIENAVEDYT